MAFLCLRRLGWEIFGALLHGGRLVVVPESVAGSPEDFHALLVAEQVSVLSQTPSAVAVLSPEGLGSVALLVAGEPCPAELVDRWAPGRVMINGYGPTETTVCASRSAPLSPGSGVVPIGSPVAGAALFVLDGWLRPVPAGVVGELYVAGAGVGCGYVAAARVDGVAVCGVSVRRGPGRGCIAPGIWCVGALMGSCGMWGAPMSRSRSAGIASSWVRCSAALAGLDGVEQAVVIAREDRPGDKRLVGYVTGTADPAEMRAALAERLPAYMVPAAVVVVRGAAVDGPTANSTSAPCRHRSTPTSIVTAPRPARSRRSWPASTPRCWGSSGSGSTTRSSIWVGTAFCRCRWWRGRVPPG